MSFHGAKSKIILAVFVLLIAAVCVGVFFASREQKTPVSAETTAASENSASSESTTAQEEHYPQYTTQQVSALGTDGVVFTSPSRTNITVHEPIVSFLGSCDTRQKLFCNDKEIICDQSGIFSTDMPLKLGENIFTFTHNGIKTTFTVTYELDILSAVSPSGKTAVSGGTSIELLALAHKQASVFAIVNGTQVELTATGRNDFQQSDSRGTSDYVTFVGTYTLPAYSETVNTGKIVFSAEYNGITKTVDGGELTINAVNASTASGLDLSSVIVPSEYTSRYTSGNDGFKTAYTDYGYGTTLMCEILKDYAETTPGNDTSDKSNPLYSPLLRGTFDYVVGIATYDDELNYILQSGRKVHADNCKLITNGYIIASNRLSASGVKSTESSTDVSISTDWLVPTNIQLKPQDYYSGYQDRPFSVTACTAEYIDILFFHTASASGSFSVDSSDIISGAQWLNIGTNNSVTLRIHLKNAGKFYGYSITAENGKYIISVNKRPGNKKVVMLDPGHGGSDSGTYAAYSGIYENTVNLSIANRVKSILESQGYTVLMTRTSETDCLLVERVAAARAAVPDIYVSIHCDGSTSASANGTHTFYYNSFSMQLANSIYNQLVYLYKNYFYAPTETGYSSIENGCKFYPFAVTRIEECPSVLVECGYLTNAKECSLLITESSQSNVATAIANGINTYFANS